MVTKARQLAEFIANADVDSDEIATGAVSASKLAATLDLSSKTLTFAANQISGNSVDGGVISNFASTGIDDNASSTAVTILSSGNVGVGTASPAHRFHINQPGNSPQLRISGNANWDFYSYNDNNFYINNSAGTVLGFLANKDAYFGKNLSIGDSVLSTYHIHYPAVDIGSSASVQGYNGNNGVWLQSNLFMNTNGHWTSKSNDYSAMLELYDGNFNFYNTASGTGTRTLLTPMTIRQNGNVGIGTSSPSFDLQLNKSSTPTFRIEETTNTVRLDLRSNSDHTLIRTTSNHDMRFNTNQVDRMTIKNDGKVGIGTTSPDSLLHLQKTRGTISDGSNDTGAVIKLHTEAQWESGYGNNSSDATNDYLGSIEFSTGDSSTGEGVRAAIRGTVDSYYNQNSIVFETCDHGDTTLDERVRILHNGNVGIGTANPGYKLEVAGTAHVTNTLSANAISIPSQGMIFNQAFGTGVPSITMTGTANNGRAGAINFKESDGSGGAIANTAAIYSTDGAGGNASYGGLTIAAYQSDIRFSTGSLAGTKMIVQAGGNVGIGIQSPMSQLHVNKDVTGHNTNGITIGKVEANGWIDINEEMGRLSWSASYGSSYTPGIGAYISAKADANWDGNETPTRLGFFTAPVNSLTPVERLRITSNGSVKVKNAADDASQFIFNDGWSAEARNIRVWAEEEASGGTGRWFSFLGTNVSKDGDGTYTKLSDDAAANWGNIAGMLFTGANTAGQNAIDFIVDLPSAHGGGLNVGMSGSNLYNKSAMSITADGKVGIGTSSPGQKLTVAGGIESTSGQGSVSFYSTTAGSYNQQNGTGGTAWAYGSTGGSSAPNTAASTTFGFHHWNGSAWSNPLSLTQGGQLLASAAGKYTGLNSNAWVTFGRLYGAQSTPLNIKVIVGHNSNGGYNEFTNDTYAYNIAAGTVVTIGNTTGSYTCQIRKVKRIGGQNGIPGAHYNGGDGGWEYQVARNQAYGMSVGLHVMGVTTGWTWTI